MSSNKRKSNCRAAALIVAAGRGSRLGVAEGRAKQYLELGGKPVLAWSIEALAGHLDIACVQVVIHPDDRALYDDAIAGLSRAVAQKVLPSVEGAETRQGSTLKGLEALRPNNPDVVFIHDAARPFLPSTVIDALRTALQESKGAIPALPVADTLKRSGSDNRIEATVPRDGLWQAQTPQVFRFDTICAAHEVAANADRGGFTDDASIVEAYGEAVAIVAGDANLRKITTADDLAWARAHCGRSEMSNMETRVGQGFDVHAFADGDAVILCGVRIPHSKKLAGHSDADVGLHALTDAILGGLGDGDIGAHFPPSDPKWKGTDSTLFLKDANSRLRKRNGRLVHIDITLICEEPKIGPHRPAMISSLSGILGVTEDRISIKATTTERLGFAGREEGIAALATATIALPADT